MAALSVPQQECDDVVSFALSLKDDIADKPDDLKIGIRTSVITFGSITINCWFTTNKHGFSFINSALTKKPAINILL